MSERIVTKSGGTSNATAEAVATSSGQMVGSVIGVVSAPGKLNDMQLDAFPEVPGVPHDFLGKKVTDQLISAYEVYIPSGDVDQYILDSIQARYMQVVNGLGISSLRGTWEGGIPYRVKAAVMSGRDSAVTLGEQMQAEIYQAMGWTPLDPLRAPTALFPRKRDLWKAWLSEATRDGTNFVLPGNTYNDGENVRAIDRGGSDVTGSLASYAVSADVYRNMTDTPAQSADPEIITDDTRRRNIDHLTYEEGRELGRNGTGLLHPEAIVPLMGTGIPTEVIDTFNPSGPITRYTDEVDDESRTGKVMAVSLIPEAAVITVHEPGMSENIGRVAQMSTQIAQGGINLVDVVGYGSDREQFMVRAEDAVAAQQALETLINGQGSVDSIDCSIITLVGWQLKKRALDIRVELALNADLAKQYQFTTPIWNEGMHSIRFTTDRNQAVTTLDKAHRIFIEQGSNVRMTAS